MRRDRGVEVLAEHGENGHVAQRLARATRQPSPQRRLLDEAQLARNAEARLVPGLDPDLDPVGLADLEADARERRRGLGDESLPRRRRAHEVADLEAALPDPRVESRAAELLRLVRREDPVREVVTCVESRSEATQQLRLLLERLRLELDPRHPRPQMLEARVDRLLRQRCIPRLVAADDEALGLDPVRSRRALPAHATRPTSTQPLWPPRPIACESATSACP